MHLNFGREVYLQHPSLIQPIEDSKLTHWPINQPKNIQKRPMEQIKSAFSDAFHL